MLDTLNVGGSGCISASANLTIKECHKVHLAWKSKQSIKAKEAQNNLKLLRTILEINPFISGLKSLFAKRSNSEMWKNMLPPFYPLTCKQILSIENQLKEVGFDLEHFFRKD